MNTPISSLRRWAARSLDAQYRRPTGPVGRWIARKMVNQHQAETRWTISLLAARPTDRILEIGFGPGAAVEQLSHTVTEGLVAGIDFSRTMVSVARKRNAKAVKAGRVDLRYGDVASLPFPDDSFDKAYGIHTIYFWPDPLSALKELRRVLVPGGSLVITMLPRDKWTGSGPNGTVGTPECVPYMGEEIVEMMCLAGFSRTRCEADVLAAAPSNYSVIANK